MKLEFTVIVNSVVLLILDFDLKRNEFFFKCDFDVFYGSNYVSAGQ